MEVILDIIEIAYLLVLLVILVRLTALLKVDDKPTIVEEVKKIIPKRKRMTAEQKERQRDFERSMAVMRNVDVYDGTSYGQQEIK